LPCPPCQPCDPTPLANSYNDPCARQCQDSTIVIEPSPMEVILARSILSSLLQSTIVGSPNSAADGSTL
ncbi:KRF1 protein, partial [Herpetotheres cachinnans]|nr:KRF1 protein [Herpetotheres cachinnans]